VSWVRFLTNNSYNWTGQTTPNTATAFCYSITVQQSPLISSTPTFYTGIYLYKNQTGGAPASISKGRIGLAINGVPFYGNSDAINRDAYIFEGPTFDSCKGHASPYLGTSNGIYHYHNEPGPGCVYTDTTGQHSPLYGILIDGVPIYGKYGDSGVIPTNLDACNGHTDNTYKYYHYHVTANYQYPYLTNCLMGCLNGTTVSTLMQNMFPDNRPMVHTHNGVKSIMQPQMPVTYPCINPVSYDYSALKTQLSSLQKPFASCLSSSERNIFSLFYLILSVLYLFH